MRTFFRQLIIAVTVLLLLSSPAFGGWQGKVANNQIKTKEYIAQLKAGANPDSLTRPALRRSSKYKAKQSQKALTKAMDDAEALARSGKFNLIKVPEFEPKGASKKKGKK